jgi:hypothetical protein
MQQAFTCSSSIPWCGKANLYSFEPTEQPFNPHQVHIGFYYSSSPNTLFPNPPSMPPTTQPPKLLPPHEGPRLIVYAQTFHDDAGNYYSLLPLLTNNAGLTHVIVAAIHLNEDPQNITLNDHSPDDKRFEQLWGEVKWLQGSGVKVLGMLGGAAKGSYLRLSGSEDQVCIRPVLSICYDKASELKSMLIRCTVRSLLRTPKISHTKTQPGRPRPGHRRTRPPLNTHTPHNPPPR